MRKLAIIVGLLAGGTSLVLGHLYLTRLESEASGGAKVSILALAADAPAGAVLGESSLILRDVPRGYVEPRQVRATDAKAVLGARLATGMKANEALLWSDLAQFGDPHRVLSGLVTQGQRAIALDEHNLDFDGLLRPGDRVDILVSPSGKDGTTGTTVPLLQNVLILSVAGSMQRHAEGESTARRGASVSVSASMEQAQLLVQAQRRGHLSLVLRNPEDIAVTEGAEAAAQRLFADVKPGPAGAPTEPSKEKIEHVR